MADLQTWDICYHCGVIPTLVKIECHFNSVFLDCLEDIISVSTYYIYLSYFLSSIIQPQFRCYFLRIMDGFDHPFTGQNCTMLYEHHKVQLDYIRYSQSQLDSQACVYI